MIWNYIKWMLLRLDVSLLFQEPFVNIPDQVIREALQVLLGNLFFFLPL